MLDIIRAPIDECLTGLGYELVDLEYKKQYGQMNLTIFIYKKEGITLDDCELVHGHVDELLDRLDPTNGAPYVLNVSSPGLDRPIVTDDDVRRALDTEVEVILKTQKKNKVVGTLLGRDADGNVILNAKNKQTTISKDDISVVRPYIKF